MSRMSTPNISGTTSHSRVAQPTSVDSPGTVATNVGEYSSNLQYRCRGRCGGKTCRRTCGL